MGWKGCGLETRPLKQRDSTPRPGPSARQRARPAGLSERRNGLWRRPFGHARALALQGRLGFFPLNIAAFVRSVVAPAVTALRLLPRV